VIFIYGNAQSYFITSPKPATVKTALARYFKKGDIPYLAAIAAGGVWNGTQRVKSADEELSAGQTLRVFISPTQSVRYQLPESSIVTENRDFIVVLKPAGLSTVPDRACDRFNLTFAVGQYLRGKGLRYSPIAISRLDLMVQGIVIFPKHKSAEKKLFAMMQAHEIRKLYRVTLQRPPKEASLSCYRTVDLPIDFGKKAVIHSGKGKASRTIFIKRNDEGTEWTAIPVTGRRHQIRVHAAATVGAIAGDSIYGGKSSDRIHLSAVGLNLVWIKQRHRIRFSGEFPEPLRMEAGRIIGEGVAQW
jgi:23S rRNA-/tRNA-specific pseudouridylate synthase